MKHLSLAAMGLTIALSVGAQTAPDQQQQPTPSQKENTKTQENAEAAKPRDTNKTVQPTERAKTRTKVDENVNKSERTRVNGEEKIRGDERHNGARVDEQGNVSHSTTVFRNGRETHESLALHRGFRERSDTHFGIGTHPRDWWLRTYSIVLIDGCNYYLADNGCWYPAYGFDPSCNYPDGVVYCE